MDIERRLKDHLVESGQRMNIASDDPTTIMNAGPPRSGKVVQVMTAVLLVAMAGGGFWLLSDEKDGVTEIAAGEAEAVDEDEASSEPGNGPVNLTKIELDFQNITSDISPSGNGQVIIDNGMYYLLSTAPGRVKFDWDAGTDEEFFELMRQNSFYVYSESDGWQVSTVEDRFISDFDVKDGVLYVVSTGGVDSDQAAVGTSTDQGKSWDWRTTDNLPRADQVTIMASGDQPLIFASRWGNANYEEAIKLAGSAGVELTPMTLYSVDGSGFTYVPIEADKRCDFVLGQFLPGYLEFENYRDEMGQDISDEEFEEMRTQELRWISDEIQANGCSLPENLEAFSFEDLPQLPEPVSKTWEGLGVTPPESWQAWAGMYRFDGENLNALDLPYGPDVQTSYARTNDGQLVISVLDQSHFAEGNIEDPGGETVFITSDGESWTEEFQPYPQSDEDFAASWFYDGSEYVPPVIGDRAFRLWWDEEQFMEEPEDGVWVEPTPELQQKVGEGEWENVPLGDVIGDTKIGDRQLWEVRGSNLGVFLIFGPRWDEETGRQTEDSQIALYSSNGTDWESIELAGQSLHYVNNGNELLLFSTDWEHEDGNYSVTETYLVRPKG
jgi:hypothetical protein